LNTKRGHSLALRILRGDRSVIARKYTTLRQLRQLRQLQSMATSCRSANSSNCTSVQLHRVGGIGHFVGGDDIGSRSPGWPARRLERKLRAQLSVTQEGVTQHLREGGLLFGDHGDVTIRLAHAAAADRSSRPGLPRCQRLAMLRAVDR
jgi:hypothetical protein